MKKRERMERKQKNKEEGISKAQPIKTNVMDRSMPLVRAIQLVHAGAHTSLTQLKS